MSATNYDSVQALGTCSYNYKIRVRVIRLWRGATRTGEEFKNFNVILLDSKIYRIHAFIPTSRAEELAQVLKLGKNYKIRNFTVQLYKPTDKFRCLRNDRQIVFTKDTYVQEIAEDEVNIPLDYFDFYGHNQLEELSNQKTYLTDVIGIVKKHDKFRDLENRHGQKQKQSKLVYVNNCNQIFLGRSNVNITFCDAFGIKFENAMKEAVETPNKVLTHMRIKAVDDTTNWCYSACTGCRKEIKQENSVHVSEACNTLVPCPEIKYRISVLAEDNTDDVHIILGDKEVRTLIMKKARNLFKEVNKKF
ncbi:uncharacterized protein LOC141696398 [Apium graveolens]|uniref:uncharacterized protein LOC141696398 n=1 Tax=Apium graveolens TaxID=4045 RepID=UPI003D7A24BE